MVSVNGYLIRTGSTLRSRVSDASRALTLGMFALIEQEY